MSTVYKLALYLIENNGLNRVLEVLEAIEDFLPHRECTIKRMREEADKLDVHKFNGNIAQVAGAGAGLGAIIIGAALAPITFGISFGVGLGVGAVGLATSAGTRAVLWKLSKNTEKEIDEILKKDKQKYAKLHEKWSELDIICKPMQRMEQNCTWDSVIHFIVSVTMKIVEFFISFALGKIRKVGKIGKTVFKTLMAAYSNEYFHNSIVKPLQKGNIKLLFQNIGSIITKTCHEREFWEVALESLGLAADICITAFTCAAGSIVVSIGGGLALYAIHDLIDSILNIAQGSVAEASCAIRKDADKLEKQYLQLKELSATVKKLSKKHKYI